MDTDAILRRRPELCVVDEFPHTNVPGSERLKRWQDVQILLDAGIDVLTTMNIQHLESLNDQIWNITGIRVRETIPDWVMQQADQVVMVDLTPRALLNRLARGVVYSQEKAQKALENFFQESTLVVLRELALRQTAHEVEIRQVDYDAPGFEPEPGYHDEAEQPPDNADRILILVTPEPATAMLIRRGKRVADYLHADCFAVAVSREIDLHDMPARDREMVEQHLNFARNLHIETRVLQGQDVAKTLVEFAHLNGVTHLFMARPQPSQWPALSRTKPGAASGALSARYAGDYRGRPGQSTTTATRVGNSTVRIGMPDNKTVFFSTAALSGRSLRAGGRQTADPARDQGVCGNRESPRYSCGKDTTRTIPKCSKSTRQPISAWNESGIC